MKVRYIGTLDPTENLVTEVFGLSFTKDEWVNVEDDVAQRLNGNPTFEVTDGKAAKAAAAAAPPEPAPEVAAEGAGA
jgi:hypothetical protein